MKKVCLSLLITIMIIVSLSACSFRGYDWVDTNYHFDRAIISLPNGEVVEGKVVKWTDSEDGEQLTITLDNGKRYLVSSYSCILIEDDVE